LKIFNITKLKNKPSPYIYIQFLLHVKLTNFANFLGKFTKFSISHFLLKKPSHFIYTQFILHVNSTNSINFFGKFYQNLNFTKLNKKPSRYMCTQFILHIIGPLSTSTFLCTINDNQHFFSYVSIRFPIIHHYLCQYQF
jgi:hypothetical protein